MNRRPGAARLWCQGFLREARATSTGVVRGTARGTSQAMATDEGSMTQPPMDLVYEAEDLGWMQMLIGLLRVGRVHFNLAENRRDAEAPFAFLANLHHAPVGASQSPAPAGSTAKAIRSKSISAALLASSRPSSGNSLLIRTFGERQKPGGQAAAFCSGLAV